MHGGVHLRMSDQKLVAPWLPDRVGMGWGRVSSRSPVRAPYLRFRKLFFTSTYVTWRVADAMLSCEVNLEEGGFRSRWFLGYLGPVQL